MIGTEDKFILINTASIVCSGHMHFESLHSY